MDYRGAVIRSWELRRPELLKSFPGANVGVALPAEARKLLGNEAGSKPFPGAYAPRD